MHIMCPRPFDGITELIEKLKKKSILIALVTFKEKKNKPMNKENQIILYQDNNDITRVSVRFADEDLWLT